MERIDNSDSAELKELEDIGNRMPATFTKLFGRDRHTIKTAAAAKVAKKGEKFHRYEVYCIEKGTTDILRGNARASLPKAVIEIKRSDDDTTIRYRVWHFGYCVSHDYHDRQ